MIKFSEIDKGRRVIASLPNLKDPKHPEIRTGTFVGIDANGLPLIKYDIYETPRLAYAEWLTWDNL